MNWAWLRTQIVGALSVAECQTLSEQAGDTKTTKALEVGHYLGLSTAVLLQSLPTTCELITVDHHQGDKWSAQTSEATFAENVAPYVKDREFTSITGDMNTVLPTLDGGFGFVFYDADHSRRAVERFWKAAAPLLEDDCTLVFDDADWHDQSSLIGLAEAEGFSSVRTRFFHRGELDKKDPETYTLEVMKRSPVSRRGFHAA